MVGSTVKKVRISKFFLVEELAARWKCHAQTIRRMVREGKITPILQDGPRGKILIPASTVDTYETKITKVHHAAQN